MCCLAPTKLLDPKENNLSNRYFYIFDLVLVANDLHQLKDEIIEESRIGHDYFNLSELGLIKFCLSRVFSFHEFIEWCAQNYSKSHKVIMPKDRTKVLCQVTSQLIHEALCLSQHEFEYQEFIEGSFTLMYKQMSSEVKTEKLSKLIKPEQTLDGLSLPYPNHIFIPRVQFAITTVSQV